MVGDGFFVSKSFVQGGEQSFAFGLDDTAIRLGSRKPKIDHGFKPAYGLLGGCLWLSGPRSRGGRRGRLWRVGRFGSIGYIGPKWIEGIIGCGTAA